MVKAHDKKHKKKAAKKAAKHNSRPFRFLDLLPEIRRVVYRHYFAGVSVIINDDNNEDDDDAGQLLEDVVTFSSRATHLQHGDTDEEDEHYESEGEKYLDDHDMDLARIPIEELSTSKEVQASSENQWRDIDSDDEEWGQIKIHSDWAARLGRLLLTCKQIREEAQPVLCASVHLKVLAETIEIQHLPKFSQQLYLSRIQEVTIQTMGEYPERYSHGFDVRQMPNLKTVHLLEGPTQHSKYVLGDVDPDVLVNFVHGEKDGMFVQDWFEREAKIARWEKDYASKQDPAVQQILRLKNDARYWPHRMMFQPNERNFKIVYRRYLTLILQNLWPDEFAAGRVPKSILSEARGRVFLVSHAAVAAIHDALTDMT